MLPLPHAALRRRLTAAVHDFQGAAAQYEDVILHGLDLEAVVKCRQLGVYEPPGLDTAAAGTRATLQRLAWRYRCSIEVSEACSCAAACADDVGCFVFGETVKESPASLAACWHGMGCHAHCRTIIMCQYLCPRSTRDVLTSS